MAATMPVTGATTPRSLMPGRSTTTPGSSIVRQYVCGLAGAEVSSKFFCACGVSRTVWTGAQATPDRLAQSVPKISHPLPFKFGETLFYEVSFSKFIFSGTIGELKLWVSKTGPGPEAGGEKPEMIELRAEAVSKGFFPKLFGLKVRDRFTSVVSPQDFGLHTSVKLIEE